MVGADKLSIQVCVRNNGEWALSLPVRIEKLKMIVELVRIQEGGFYGEYGREPMRQVLDEMMKLSKQNEISNRAFVITISRDVDDSFQSMSENYVKP